MFSSLKWSLVMGLAATSMPGSVDADLRMASQPRAGFAVKQRNAVQFESKTAIYMEPSDFQYAGLRAQRDNGAYDNFLRSNIDNEQDKRNFNNEAGRDMLPFRSFEGAEQDDGQGTVQTKIPAGAPGPTIVANPGQSFLIPLRWNNPHASELEVNVWIMNGAYVVPIRKPTCSGEGHQDNVLSATIPTDFNNLGSVVPGFAGCKKEGDCVLQTYAHSVEPRTYAIGTPIVITGDVPAATATNANGIQPAQKDVGTNLDALTHELCLPSNSDQADIKTAVPRVARLVSDVFNHAYQNSDYSPYSGQQPEAISRNLQASAIISMIPANQGELGKALFKQTNKAGAALQAKLKAKVDALVKRYEGITNNIIAKIGDATMKDTAVVGDGGVQKLATCFRCAETGSLTTTRQTTNTYVPSFQIAAAQVAAARKLVPAQYAGLIDADGTLKLYEAVLNDMKADFTKAAAVGLVYQPAIVKTSTTTMTDVTKFRKVNAQGQQDNGIYAATAAQATKKAAAAAVSQNLNGAASSLSLLSADELPDISAFGATTTEGMVNMDNYNYDTPCDDDTTDTSNLNCDSYEPTPMFALSADGELQVQDAPTKTATSTATTTSATVLVAVTAVAAGVAALY